MEMSKWSGAGVPAVVYGPPSERAYLFVHGRCGRKEEAEAFAALACGRGCQVVAVDLPGHGERSDMDRFVPWCAVPELRGALDAITDDREKWTAIARLEEYLQRLKLNPDADPAKASGGEKKRGFAGRRSDEAAQGRTARCAVESADGSIERRAGGKKRGRSKCCEVSVLRSRSCCAEI